MDLLRHALLGTLLLLVMAVHVKHLCPDLWFGDVGQSLFASSSLGHNGLGQGHPELVALTVATVANEELCRWD
jgi:hypothetical protein